MKSHQYEVQNIASSTINKEYIKVGVGLNQVDNLVPSAYFYEALEESKTYQELEDKITKYYAQKEQINTGEQECDVVSQRIAHILESKAFSFSSIHLKSIHRELFMGIFPKKLEKYIGVFRDTNITKQEEILNYTDSVTYANYSDIEELLEYDFKQEKTKNYIGLYDKEKICEIAKFTSNIWQIHPFREGNTRTIAVFIMQYLNTMGFKTNNEIFQINSEYFRNALVLANYRNINKNITEDNRYLESFFSKLFNDKNSLVSMPKSLENLVEIVRKS